MAGSVSIETHGTGWDAVAPMKAAYRQKNAAARETTAGLTSPEKKAVSSHERLGYFLKAAQGSSRSVAGAVSVRSKPPSGAACPSSPCARAKILASGLA